MNNELFWYICNNQTKWGKEYREQQKCRERVRRIINRKYTSKGKKFIEDIKKDLQALEVGELIENPVSKELEFHFGGEQYSLGVSNKRETK